MFLDSDEGIPMLDAPSAVAAPVAAAAAAPAPLKQLESARPVPLKHNGLPVIEHSIASMRINVFAKQQQQASAGSYHVQDSAASLPTGAGPAESQDKGDGKRGRSAAASAASPSAAVDESFVLEQPDELDPERKVRLPPWSFAHRS
jgi:hypothetical protein